MTDLANLDAKGLLARFCDDRVTMLYVNDETLLLIGGDVASGQSNGRMGALLRVHLWDNDPGAWRATSERARPWTSP